MYDYEVYDTQLLKWLCNKTRLVVQSFPTTYSYEDMLKQADNDGIIVDPLTIDNIFMRTYNKNHFGDILPLGDLYLIEVHALYKYLDLGDDKVSLLGARGWGPSDIEWANRQNDICSIISSEEDPVKHRDWNWYSAKQREMVAKMHQIEKRTRHKTIYNIPVCRVRNIKGLVR